MSRDKLSNGMANIYVAISIKMMPCDMFKDQVSQSLFNEKFDSPSNMNLFSHMRLCYYMTIVHMNAAWSLTIPMKCCAGHAQTCTSCILLSSVVIIHLLHENLCSTALHFKHKNGIIIIKLTYS